MENVEGQETLEVTQSSLSSTIYTSLLIVIGALCLDKEGDY